MWFFKKNKYPLGVIGKDPKDIRDFQLLEVQPTIVVLPETFDLRDKMTSVQLQNWGTCTSHDVDGVKEFLDSKEYGKQIKLSQKFIYYNTKKISGLWNMQGDYVRNALKAVCEYGVCLEETFPDIRRLNWETYIKDVPSEQAYKEAEKYKGKTYWVVGNTLEQFRQAIYQQKAPVVCSMMWFESYYKTESDGKLPLPDKSVGGHAISCVGWTKDKLWFRNSHGTDWGLNGYFYIPFNEFNRHDIWNCWILLDIEVPEPENTKIGWIADSWLSKEWEKGDIVWPTYKLNFRIAPWGQVIKVLEVGKKLEVLGEKKKTNEIVWQKVKEL